MNILGVGTDIIETSRIEEMIQKHGEIFLDRVFTKQEQEYCGIRKAASQHYAGRWAAKEAILKAFGTGWAKGIHWTDIEVVNEMGGKPNVVTHGEATTLCDQRGIVTVLISISHCKEYAVAFATAVTGQDP